MNPFLAYQRQLLTVILVASVAGVIALFVGFPGQPAYAWGLALGAIGGVVKFRLDVLTIVQILQSEDDVRRKAASSNGFKTYLLMAGVLALGYALQPDVNTWFVLGGLVIEHVIRIGDGLLRPGATGEPNGETT